MPQCHSDNLILRPSSAFSLGVIEYWRHVTKGPGTRRQGHHYWLPHTHMADLIQCGGVAEEGVRDCEHISSCKVCGCCQVIDGHTQRTPNTIHQHTGTMGEGAYGKLRGAVQGTCRATCSWQTPLTTNPGFPF